MKSIFIFSLALLVSFSAFSQSVSKKEAKSFCQSFTNAIVAGDLNEAMKSIDPDYKKIQHDKFLEGRTDQFFSELLAGKDKNGEYISPSVKEISSVKVGKIVFSELDGNSVWLAIVLKNGTKLKSRIMFNVSEDNKITIVGALG
jgi:hypothetical protein